jgi:ketosteroid isomerase-like protein
MSQENVDLIRETFARFQAGDARWADLVDPDIEWDFSAYPLADIPTRGRGREDVLTKVIETYYSGWRDYEAEITEMIEAGDDTVVIQHEVVRVADSDQALERDTFHVWTVRDGSWVRWLIFPDRDSALEAAGLRE